MRSGDTRVPMKMRSVKRLAALMLLMQLGGCASMQSLFGSQVPPAAQRYSHAHRQLAPTTVRAAPLKEDRNTNRASTVRKEPATASAPAQAPPAPAKTTRVTLEDNDADHLRAQALVDDADARLAQIDRSKLTGESATAYNQASDLASAARQAMTQQDYLAASGLARKATLLTEQLASRTAR